MSGQEENNELGKQESESTSETSPKPQSPSGAESIMSEDNNDPADQQLERPQEKTSNTQDQGEPDAKQPEENSSLDNERIEECDDTDELVAPEHSETMSNTETSSEISIASEQTSESTSINEKQENTQKEADNPIAEDNSDTDPSESDTNNKSHSDLERYLTDEEKKYVHIDAEGNLILNATDDIKERKIAHLTESNAETVLAKLREQYVKVQEEITKLKTNFELQGDQVVLYPDVLAALNYLNTIEALGNLSPLMASVLGLSQQSQELIRARVTKYKQILDRFRAFLTEEVEDIRTADQTVKSLHQVWKEAGHLPNKENHELYDELKKLQDEYTVKRRERQRKDDLIQLNNLDRKKEIISKAQEIAATDEWKAGHTKMQELFKEWKSIGRVPLDKKDSIWEEFKAAKNTFYDRRKEFYAKFMGDLEENYAKKDEIVSQIEALQDSTDWKTTSDKIEALDKQFSQVGQVPKEKWKPLLDRLHNAKRNFFGAKNKHYEEQRKDFEENLVVKNDLANRVEALQDSTDWRNTTQKMNTLFDQWKASGPTYRSKENKIWERFIGARKHFFERKDAYFAELNKKHHKENILRLDQEKNNLQQLKSDLQIDRETLDQLYKDYESESNDRFKGKIKETLEVLENKIANDEKLVKEKEQWIDKTEKQIDKAEEEAQKAKEEAQKPQEKSAPNEMTDKAKTDTEEKVSQTEEKKAENSDLAADSSNLEEENNSAEEEE